ncbi:type VII secretion target [Kitasatospora sp. NPDC088264]|uniref:type VII secretion target n=1 Tax=unclassified Kitasatospora TaxID=2633591 RepID=UPI00343B14EB
MNAYAGSDGPGLYGPYGPPAGGPLFGVNPADLDAAAKVAKDTGEAMPGELKHIHEPSDTAVAALSGWRTGASLHACTAAWEECLNKLASEVDGVSLKLGQTAGNYRGTDTGNAGALKPPGAGPYAPAVN